MTAIKKLPKPARLGAKDEKRSITAVVSVTEVHAPDAVWNAYRGKFCALLTLDDGPRRNLSRCLTPYQCRELAETLTATAAALDDRNRQWKEGAR